MIIKRQKALIHVARQKVGMSEEDYRAMLSGFGVESSVSLSQVQFERALAHFRKLGFEVRKKGPRRGGPRPVAKSRDLLRGKVRALMAVVGVTDAYTDAMAKHMFQVNAWIWLDSDKLHKLVAALNYHRLRHPDGGHERTA